jgi:hypothetical protein
MARWSTNSSSPADHEEKLAGAILSPQAETAARDVLPTVDAMKPERPGVESTIQGVRAETQNIEDSKIAKQAEI